MGLARSLSQEAGLRYVTLDALPRDGLVRWYEGYGFKKNLAEQHFRRIIKRSGRESLQRRKLEEIELPHISMRFDILLEGEVPKK